MEMLGYFVGGCIPGASCCSGWRRTNIIIVGWGPQHPFLHLSSMSTIDVPGYIVVHTYLELPGTAEDCLLAAELNSTYSKWLGTYLSSWSRYIKATYCKYSSEVSDWLLYDLAYESLMSEYDWWLRWCSL